MIQKSLYWIRVPEPNLSLEIAPKIPAWHLPTLISCTVQFFPSLYPIDITLISGPRKINHGGDGRGDGRDGTGRRGRGTIAESILDYDSDSDVCAKKGEHLKSKFLGLLLGPLAFAALASWPGPVDLPVQARMTGAVALWMVVWWIFEAIPIPATSLLPLVLFPVFGIMNIGKTSIQYADKNVFLFMGGFMMALGMEKWGLHRRIALRTIQILGTGQRRLVLGFMLASAFLSMWISNTATTMLMLPVALAVIEHFENRRGSDRLATVLLLGVAYAASVGGIGTLVGTPPNIVLAGTVKKLLPGTPEIGFAQWMKIGVPLVIVFLPLMWLVLTRVIVKLPADREKVDLSAELGSLGPMSRGEWSVLVVFGLVALGWILRKPVLSKLAPGISDAGLAMAGALVLFIIPADKQFKEFILDWKQASHLPWGVLILFGGGFALAAAMHQSGLSAWLGNKLSVLKGMPLPLTVFIVAAFMAALTELTSNTATTMTMLPILAAVALGTGKNPLLLMVPATMAASCAFMLPVATPPNAIVFGSGKIRLAEMFKIGLWMEIMGVILITLLVTVAGNVVF
ncbi:MAG: SLC13/DASS family transporter [Deltaproteobacteria bacterium]|nr:SLC13/DASS family transporter [Deltaproteobacteria bacterium]